MDIDVVFVRVALEEARAALAEGEVPVGALIVRREEIIARAHNRPIAGHDPTAHAEILAIRKAAAVTGNYRLSGTTLYVTLEPCLMCVGAIIQARIERLVFGAKDPKGGAVVSLYQIMADGLMNHNVQVTGGVMAEECSDILQAFFRGKREGRL